MPGSIRRSLPTPPPGASPLYFRLLRSVVGVAAFLVGFTVALLALLNWYVRPALTVRAHADAIQRRELGLHAILLLMTLLLLLVIWLMIIFPVRNWFTPASARPGKPTEYPDAWTEAARRLETPPEDEV
jgi:hypothetical protein